MANWFYGSYFKIHLCIILSITALCFSNVRHLKTNQELSEFRSLQDAQAIFYYHHDESQGESFKSRMQHILLSVDSRLEDLPKFIILGLVNCQSPNIDSETISECLLKKNVPCKVSGIGLKNKKGCSKRKRVLMAYSGERSEEFNLKEFHNDDSFIANMVNFVFQDEIGIAQDLNDWKEHKEHAMGHEDIILMYVLGVGNLDHYSFMEFFLKHRQKYRFVFSTDRSFAVELGIKEEMQNGLWYAKCSKVNSESCPIQHFSSSIMSSAAIETFIDLQQLPLIIPYQEHEDTPFTYYLDTHTLFLFVDNDEDKENVSSMVENVIERCETVGVRFRGVILDRRLHKEVTLMKFGFNNETILPTAVFQRYGQPEWNKQLDPFSPDEDFVEDAIFDFTYKLVKNHREYYNSIDQVNHIEVVKGSDWVGHDHLQRKTLIGVCSNGHPTYEEFKKNFRRLVRTMYSDSKLDVDFIYIDQSLNTDATLNADSPNIDESGRNTITSFKVIPTLALFIPKKGMETLEEFDDGYLGILQWVNKQLGAKFPVLPLSGVDLLLLQSKQELDENEELVMNDDGLEELERYQEDEIGKDIMDKRNQLFYSDEVPAITDRNFKKIINESDLVVVFFYLLSDDVSFLFREVYASIHGVVGKFDSKIATKVTKVDCESEYDTCRNINSYPTISFYSKGNHLGDYAGLLEAKSLIKAIQLYQEPALQKLTETSILRFKEESGSIEKDCASILGWFAGNNNDFMIFKKVASENRGKMLFAYAMGEATKTLIGGDSSSSLVFAYKQNKTVRSFNGDIELFTAHQLRRFLLKASIPQFGELTISNFPAYKSLKLPIIVLFTPNKNKMQSVAWKSIFTVAESNLMDNHALFTWMNTDLEITKEIRRSYVGARKEKQPTIVLVDHAKAKVYRYSEELTTPDAGVKGISEWIRNCLDGKVKPTSFLKKLNWNPRREGFDFLHMIENDHTNGATSNTRSSGEGHRSEDSETSIPNSDFINVHGMKIPRNQNHASPDAFSVNKNVEERNTVGSESNPIPDESLHLDEADSFGDNDGDELFNEGEISGFEAEVSSGRISNVEDDEESNDVQFIPSGKENDDFMEKNTHKLGDEL